MAAKALEIVWRDSKNIADNSKPPVKVSAGCLGIVKISRISETVIAAGNTVLVLLVVLHVS